MNFIKRWIKESIDEALKQPADGRTAYGTSNMLTSANAVKHEDGFREQQSMNIEVRNVIGGRIVTFRNYDYKVDRSEIRSYIITEDAEFEQELGKIITIESMRQ